MTGSDALSGDTGRPTVLDLAHPGFQVHPRWPRREPAWPKWAYFLGLRRRRAERFSTSLPAITHENPLRLAKLLNLKDLELAERVGFEPTCRFPDNTLSRRARYDHFGTSPQR